MELSLSFFQAPSFLVGDMGLGFCITYKTIDLIPSFYGQSFPQSHIASPNEIDSTTEENRELQFSFFSSGILHPCSLHNYQNQLFMEKKDVK